MTTDKIAATWHKDSFNRFLNERLPALLAERLPLTGYSFRPLGEHACQLRVAVSTGAGEVAAEYELPCPDAEGVFELDGRRRVVVPLVNGEDLAQATIRCVGEQLYDFIEQHLGQAPADLPWDQELLRSFAPLDLWVRATVLGDASVTPMNPEWDGGPIPSSQVLDEQNWLARQASLRRLIVVGGKRVITQSQFGRACPFETPEGTNIGRILTVAVGATIRDGKLVLLDDWPEAALGLTASMVPFLEHNDPNRQLMGVNMMRQALMPDAPEPALVQTGNEPNVPGFWCGRNLLTAFISFGAETFEDAIIVSQSAANRLGFPGPLEVGDKLSNRHGTKGTVSRILPDEQMPHLPDGRPAELIYNFVGLHTRLNFGQIREAVLGRIAQAEGSPAIVPPFHAPTEEEIRRRLLKVGLNESGMEVLTLGREGPRCEQPSTVGYVYWLKLHHLTSEKIQVSNDVKVCQYQGQREYLALRDLGAFETIAETFGTRNVDRAGARGLARELAEGRVSQAAPPSPRWERLQRALAAGGILAKLQNDRLAFSFSAPVESKLDLACPIPHPWLPERPLTALGILGDNPLKDAVIDANAHASRLVTASVPPTIRDRAVARLAACVADYLESLLNPTQIDWTPRESMSFGNRVTFSGRSVLSVGADLRLDQVGLPESMCWTLLGPQVIRELGDEPAVASRTPKALAALDRVLSAAWVVINRAPTVLPTSLLAFHPVRIPDQAICLHPLACYLMNADFDGDQAAVFLPVTQAGQEEAGRLLSIGSHVRRDPTLIRWLGPVQEMVWGLARLSLQPDGRERIQNILGLSPDAPEGYVTRQTLDDALETLMKNRGVEAAMDAAQQLMDLGFEITRRSGASMSPFIDSSLSRPAVTPDDGPELWIRYSQMMAERIAACSDFASPELGPQLLSVKTGARGGISHLVNLLGPRGVIPTAEDDSSSTSHQGGLIIRHGWAEGLTPEEVLACVVPARKGLARVAAECARIGYGVRETGLSKGFNVLSRAMRSPQPGFVFAQAAAAGEIDPLTDLDSRLFVGLPICG